MDDSFVGNVVMLRDLPIPIINAPAEDVDPPVYSLTGSSLQISERPRPTSNLPSGNSFLALYSP